MPFMRRSCVWSLGWVALALLSANAQNSIKVRVQGDVVFVPVEVNGHMLNFLLDTGSERSVIDSATAASLGLKGTGDLPIWKNFRTLVVGLVQHTTLRVGKSDFEHRDFAMVNLESLSRAIGTRVDGVLGMDVLELFVFRLSYSNEILTLNPPESGVQGTQLGLHRSGDQLFVSTGLISESVDLLLDTGTNSTNLSWTTWQRLWKTWTPSSVVEGIARAGNPTSSAFLVCLPSVRLGDVKIRNQVVRVQRTSDAGAFSSEDFGGILGSDVLRHFEITFDLKHDRVFLRKDENFQPDPYKYTTVGIQFGKDENGAYRVMSVWKDSPAMNAGIQFGDRINAINGQRSSSLTPAQVSKELHGEAGTPVLLTIERDGNSRTVSVKKRALLCADEGTKRSPLTPDPR
jgi:predicted aspartyl protease